MEFRTIFYIVSALGAGSSVGSDLLEFQMSLEVDGKKEKVIDENFVCELISLFFPFGKKI